MRDSFLIRIGAAMLLLGIAAPALSACSCAQSDSGRVGTTATSTAVPAATAETSAGVSASGTAGSSRGTSGLATGGEKLSGPEASAIDAELSAIERELDRMSLPGDKDFGDIESGLE